MPLRRYEGKGGVYLPAYMHSWLMKPGGDGLNIADLGILAAILFAFEHGEPPFYKSEMIDGEIVLDAAAKYQLLAYLNPEGELGPGRVWEAVRYFADNRWLEIDTAEGRNRIRLGERALKLLEEATVAVT